MKNVEKQRKNFLAWKIFCSYVKLCGMIMFIKIMSDNFSRIFFQRACREGKLENFPFFILFYNKINFLYARFSKPNWINHFGSEKCLSSFLLDRNLKIQINELEENVQKLFNFKKCFFLISFSKNYNENFKNKTPSREKLLQ